MEKAERDREDGMGHDGLQCHVQKMSYDFRTKSGRLDFSEGIFCDMSGAIALFATVDPEVCLIDTFVGGKPDMTYRLNLGNGMWATMKR